MQLFHGQRRTVRAYVTGSGCRAADVTARDVSIRKCSQSCNETERFFEPEAVVDVLIDGPYNRMQPVEGELRGSANQEIRILTDRYTEVDLRPPGPLECIIQQDGSVSVTGFTRPPFGA